MDKFAVDFTQLDKKINAPRVYKLSDVQDRIQKVAFDVVRFRDNDDTEQLWRIEESVDGPVIVAMYSSDEPKIAEASVREWSAIVDSNNTAHILYKGEALKKITASAEINDVYLLCSWLPAKLASDKEFRNSFINDISPDSRDLLLSKYPELKG